MEYEELKDKLQVTQQLETDTLRKVTATAVQTAGEAIRDLHRRGTVYHVRPPSVAEHAVQLRVDIDLGHSVSHVLGS